MFYHNRGMYLESLINYTIDKYNQQKKAVIFKTSPQNQQIIQKNKIYKFGTVDYHGIYKSKFICFEAKTTKKNFLPWINIQKHQWNFLELVDQIGGISFLIIYFETFDAYFFIFFNLISELKCSGQKITYKWINKNGNRIKLQYPFLLDFLPLIDFNHN